MMFMVTCRRKYQSGYGDEEQHRYGYHYLYDYDNAPRGQDGFSKGGHYGRYQSVFETALLAELIRLKKEGISTPKVGIYLHGYNNDWQDSIDELYDLHKHLRKAIGYDPVLVGYSWPSSGETIHYLADREEARDAVPAFTRFLRDISVFLTKNERDCFSTSFCIAHSMGNYVLRKGMEYLSDNLGTPVGRKMFDETVMLAPDLASRDIENDGKGQYIAEFSRRVHVYYSKHDRALKASSAKRFGGHRLGRHGADDYIDIPGNVVLVDAETYANSQSMDGMKDREGNQVSVHSSHRYHPGILADVAQALSSIDRNLISKRTPVFQPDGGHNQPMNHFRLV